MKKLLLRLFIYLVLLISLPYGYFWLQAKNAIDTFLLHQPLNGEFSYSRLSLDFDGNVYLKNASLVTENNVTLFTLDQIKIKLSSIFDLLSAEEHIIYQQYPPQISIEFGGGHSFHSYPFFQLFGVSLDEEYIDIVYPKICSQQASMEINEFSFSGSVNFEIHNTADINKVSFAFDSLELFKLMGTFTVNNFSDANNDGNFISDLSLSFKDLVFLQQSTQRCLTKHHLSEMAFSQRILQQFGNLKTHQGLAVSEKAQTAWLNFSYIPDQVDLVFNLPPGKKFSQVPLSPIEQFQSSIGLIVVLNKLNIGLIFEPEQLVKQVTPTLNIATIVNKPIFNASLQIKPSRKTLNRYIGAKVSLQLNNGKSVVGYLEHVDSNGLEISQRKFKGKSLLPFKYSQIEMVKLLRVN